MDFKLLVVFIGSVRESLLVESISISGVPVNAIWRFMYKVVFTVGTPPGSPSLPLLPPAVGLRYRANEAVRNDTKENVCHNKISEIHFFCRPTWK